MPDNTSTETTWNVALTGSFGEITVDTERPCLRGLWLRQGDGGLSVKSLLSAWPSETLPYTTGAYSYVEDTAGVRYESTASCAHEVEKAAPDEVIIRGIELLPDKLRVVAPVIEDWRLSVDDAGDLRWEITRHWQRDCEVRKSAAPGLFFNLRANAVPTGSGQRRLNPAQNAVAALFWVHPDQIDDAGYPAGQAELISPFLLSCEVRNYTVYDRIDGWALAKLYTSFPNDRSLYLKADGGCLFRRGKYNSHNELGLLPDVRGERYAGVAEASLYKARKIEFAAGEDAVSALTIGSRDTADTGRQLVVDIPDKAMETSLKRFYHGLANAGMWTSQQDYGTGNQVDGWLIGTFWMPAVALMAGVDAVAAASTDPYTTSEAWRAEVKRMLERVNAQGQIEYGFCFQRVREGYISPEQGMIFLSVLESYWLTTGDTALIAGHLDKLAAIMDGLESYRHDDLLVFDRQRHKVLIYFDAWKPDGTIAYLNNWYIRAQGAYATVLAAAGNVEQAERVKARRQASIDAMNRVLWDDNAFGPGRGGYIDFIAPDGKQHTVFCSATEYLAIVAGVADERQAAAILATADERLAELENEYGYRGDATLDTLWPVEETCTAADQYPFTTYQNGSVLNCWTYFEVLARCMSGDVETAAERLRRFAEHAGRTNWFEGDSAFNIRSEPHGWGHEPYLSDQVAVAAALIHGLLGIRQTPDGIRVEGRLPYGWDKVRAVLSCLGKQYEVVRTPKQTTIREV